MQKKDDKSKRKYDKALLQYGFTGGYNNGVKKSLSLICNETLSAQSMKPSKLKRHFESPGTHNGVG